MNRQWVERIRQAAQRDADYLKNYKGHATNGPATLMEAYRRADWNSANSMIGLCDALLAEEETQEAGAAACGCIIGPRHRCGGYWLVPRRTHEEEPRVCGRCGHEMSEGEIHWGACPRPWENWSA